MGLFKRNLIAFCLINLFVCYVYGSSASSEASTVEEGWRYGRSFKLKIQHEGLSKGIDLQNLHEEMAFSLKKLEEAEKEETSKKSKSASGSGKESSDSVYCLVRFLPVLVGHGCIEVGSPIKISDAFLHSSGVAGTPLCDSLCELSFKSGFCKKDQYQVERARGYIEEIGMFSVIPSQMFSPPQMFSPFQTLSIKLMQRTYISASVLRQRLDFRYPLDAVPACFASGNYEPICLIHNETRRKIDQHKQNLREYFLKLEDRAMATSLEYVVRKSLVEDYGRKESNAFFEIPAANSYSCAEQTALEFLDNENVLQNLQRLIQKRQKDSYGYVGFIINIHCSKTPCSTCATSFAREAQDGGIFAKVAQGRPIFLLASCRAHYERPHFTDSNPIQYNETKYLEPLAVEGLLNIFDTSAREQGVPYPVILMRLRGEDSVIDDRTYKDLYNQTASVRSSTSGTGCPASSS